MLAFRFCSTGGALVVRTTWPPAIGPSAVKEGVLLDYSTDGGTLSGVKAMPCSGFPNSIHCPSEKSLQSFADMAMQTVKVTKRKLETLVVSPAISTFYICNFCAIQNLPEKGKERNHILKTPSLWVKTIIILSIAEANINDTIKK